MTVAVPIDEIATQLEEKFPGCFEEGGRDSLLVNSSSLLDVTAFLRDSPDLKFDYFNYVTAVDYYHYFEVVYHCLWIASCGIYDIKIRFSFKVHIEYNIFSIRRPGR